MVQFNTRLNTQSVSGASVHEGLRTHMLSVYNHMLVGLLLTAFVGYAFSTMITDGQGLNALGMFLFNSPFKWVLMLAPVGLVFYLGFAINKMSAITARFIFYVYAALNGIAFSIIGIAYAGETIASAFVITAVTFGAMSLWGYTTKRDLTAMGSFLMMALIGIIIASVVNIFMQSSMMHFVISALSVLVFTGLTAYDTQKIRVFYFEVEGNDAMVGRAAILGALNLYMDFIQIFLNLLQLLRGSNE